MLSGIIRKMAILLACTMPAMFSISAKQAVLDSLVQNIVRQTVPEHMGIGEVNVKGVKVDAKHKRIAVTLNSAYADVPFTAETVDQMKKDISGLVGERFSSYRVDVLIGKTDINKYLYSVKHHRKQHERFITHLDQPQAFTDGLDGSIIAMWQSHGWYFEPKLNRWEWQRARLFHTVEDLYTQSYVLPFLMPMLQNAGAYVMSPRERDVNTVELIVDNDGGLARGTYSERKGKESWSNGKGYGFAYNRQQYEVNQNPFTEGTFRQVKATHKADELSTASWSSDFPEAGEYAVYVSYKSLPESVEDAVYTINHLGGTDRFTVNQKMGGGTWIYLGHFKFAKGTPEKPVVELSNLSHKGKGIVTADAVKIGGGYGNIARIVKPADGAKPAKDIDYQYQISNYPRFTEGARYWLQWAGVPDSIYSPSENVNDYTDDYRCRGTWVNYLAGGSEVLPKEKGLGIPVDLSFAFHTDAGTTMNDSIIGTLGIYFSDNFKKYANGVERLASRRYTDLVLTNIVNDVRAQFEPEWMRRGMWDKSYYEARVPEVPAMLLELLSHQNFADMKYGLDPTFRFTVSRAIYKGMVQFIAEQQGRDYTIQPLPVNSFAIAKVSDNKFHLSWKPTTDTLCDRAEARRYYVYERIGDTDFSRVAVVEEPEYDVAIADNKVHSYRIVAVNDGGMSFPSESLSLGVAAASKGDVMVVNAFTRVCAPDWFDSGEIAGFYDVRDHGVPYLNDINFIGNQFEFRRNIPWMDDDAAGFGACRANYETKVIAGNSFDYPAVHGAAILAAGYSFTSSSVKAVEDGAVVLEGYSHLDVIMGKQKETIVGRGAVANRFKSFTKPLQHAISAYTANGGNVFVSGCYVATDLWDNKSADSTDVAFAENVLGYKWRVGQATVEGRAYSVPTEFRELAPSTYTFASELNGDVYAAESPDSLYPADSNGSTFMRYSENNLVAGIVSNRGNYRTCVLGFPFETIGSDTERATLMSQILTFFAGK